MFKDWLSCVHAVLNAVDSSIHVECLGHEGVPVVEMVEFDIDPTVVVESFTKEYLRIVKEFKVVVGQVLHIVINTNFYGFSYRRKVKS